MKTKLLDCTLRDGGYYNSWNFDITLINEYLNVMSTSGISIVELGYISFQNKLQNTRNLNTKFLKKIKLPNNIDYSCMLDFKDFKEDQLNISFFKKKLDTEFLSSFNYIRIAIDINVLNFSEVLLDYLKNLNIKVVINLIGLNRRTFTPSKDSLKKFLKSNNDKIYCLYFADSFGSFTTKDVKYMLDNLKLIWNKSIGFHAHDNQCNALQNSLFSIKNDIEYIDSTVLGMGRGAGNTKTEELLLKLDFDLKFFEGLSKLYVLIKNHFIPLKQKYNWGHNVFYSLSSKYSIHPSYIQMLLNDDRFSNEDVISIINYLKNFNAEKFDSSLKYLFDNFFLKNTLGKNSLNDINLSRKNNFIIIGSGVTKKEGLKKLKKLKLLKKAFVISLNDSSLNSSLVDIAVSSNPFRILSDYKKYKTYKNKIILPITMFPQLNNKNLKNSFDISIDIGSTFSSLEKCVTIPNLLSLSYALGIVSFFNPSNIFFIGVDGLSLDVLRHEEENDTINLFKKQFKNTKMLALGNNFYNLKNVHDKY